MLNIYLQKTVLILSRSCNYMYWNILGYDLYASAMMSMLRPIGYDLYSQTPKRWSLCSDPSALISMLRPLGYDLYAQTHWLWSLFSDLYAQTHWLRSLLLRPIGYDLYAKTSSRLFPIELFLIGRRHRREGEHFRSARHSWLVRHRHRRGRSVRG